MTTISTTASLLPTGTWTVDTSHSLVGFTVRHMMVAKTRGRFTEFTADIVTADDPAQSRVDATVQMASIDTNDEARDNHLRTNDFFDVETHPTMTFRIDERRARWRRLQAPRRRSRSVA